MERKIRSFDGSISLKYIEEQQLSIYHQGTFINKKVPIEELLLSFEDIVNSYKIKFISQSQIKFGMSIDEDVYPEYEFILEDALKDSEVRKIREIQSLKHWWKDLINWVSIVNKLMDNNDHTEINHSILRLTIQLENQCNQLLIILLKMLYQDSQCFKPTLRILLIMNKQISNLIIQTKNKSIELMTTYRPLDQNYLEKTLSEVKNDHLELVRCIKDSETLFFFKKDLGTNFFSNCSPDSDSNVIFQHLSTQKWNKVKMIQQFWQFSTQLLIITAFITQINFSSNLTNYELGKNIIILSSILLIVIKSIDNVIKRNIVIEYNIKIQNILMMNLCYYKSYLLIMESIKYQNNEKILFNE